MPRKKTELQHLISMLDLAYRQTCPPAPLTRELFMQFYA